MKSGNALTLECLETSSTISNTYWSGRIDEYNSGETEKYLLLISDGSSEILESVSLLKYLFPLIGG